MPAMPPKDEEKEDEDDYSLFSESSQKTQLFLYRQTIAQILLLVEMVLLLMD